MIGAKVTRIARLQLSWHKMLFDLENLLAWGPYWLLWQLWWLTTVISVTTLTTSTSLTIRTTLLTPMNLTTLLTPMTDDSELSDISHDFKDLLWFWWLKKWHLFIKSNLEFPDNLNITDEQHPKFWQIVDAAATFERRSTCLGVWSLTYIYKFLHD